MVADLLVRGGVVVDGSGSRPFVADVRVRDGAIREVAPGLKPDGEPQLDAAGATVAPGFIDSHTHLDPTLFWDPFCDPVPQHGVTTVLMGNCSLSLAPARPQDRETVARLLCYVEDLPSAALDQSVPWSWEAYADYAAELGRRGFGVNVAALVGHLPIRLWVMGEAAWERPATTDERARMARLLDDCLQGGAFGLSTSLGFDEDVDKRPVPSRLADDEEFGELIDVLARRGGLLEFLATPSAGKMQRDVERVAGLCGPRGVMATWNGLFYDEGHPERAQQFLDRASELQRAGVRIYPQVSPRSLDIRVNWSGGMSFFTLAAGWHRYVHSDDDTKRKLLADPMWRAVAREEWNRVPRSMLRHQDLASLRFVEMGSAANEHWVGATLADLVADRGGHPSDVLADFLEANDLRLGLVGIGVLNSDPAGVASTLRHPASIISASDTGAHLQSMCAVGDTTLLLTTYVRDRGDLTLEAGVRELTGRQAELFGFHDRGVILPGARADLTIFALDDLTYGPDVMTADLPAGGQRLRRPGGGYRFTVVEGVVTQEAGVLTGRRPGTFLAHNDRFGL